jgi:signal transduction histidine kinase
MKLAQKLTLALVLGMCVVLALECWISVRSELRLHSSDMRHDQHVTGQAFAVAFGELWRAGDRARALDLIERANHASGVTYVRWIPLVPAPEMSEVTWLPENLLASLQQGHEVQSRIPEKRGPGRLVTYVPIVVDGATPGVLELSESLAATRDYVRGMVLQRVGTATALGALSGLIAIVLGAAFVGRPMHGLVDKTRRIAAGDLSRPLEFHQRDEIGELAREIDAMCVKLENARDRIVAETTARVEAIEHLRHADRLATVGKIASGVAHELGTPLNVASHRAKMIAGGEVVGAEAADYARIIAEQTRRMTGVIRQMLDYARRHTPHKERADLRAVARQTVQLLAPLAERTGVTLRVIEGENGAYAGVDAAQIQQALTNLVVNAIQASPRDGEVTIAVEERVARSPADRDGAPVRCVALDVRDRGTGIAPEHRGLVFEPFFTTKQPGEGTGLGLAVSQGIARDHGGWLEMESRLGAGSCFSLLIPADELVASSTAPASEAENGAGPADVPASAAHTT